MGVAILGTMRTWTGILPDDCVSTWMVATSRFLFVDVLAPNADRLIVSLLVGQRPSFVASAWDIKERCAPSSKSRLASAQVVAEQMVAIAVLSRDVWVSYLSGVEVAGVD